MIQLLFIIISVAAIAIFSEKHGLNTLNEFLEYVQDDKVHMALVLGVVVAWLSMFAITLWVQRWFSKKVDGR